MIHLARQKFHLRAIETEVVWNGIKLLSMENVKNISSRGDDDDGMLDHRLEFLGD